MESQKGSKETVQLKRELGVIAGTSHMMGSIIGSGIFVSASSALGYTGSVGLCLIVWASCGFLCFLAALVFAELGVVVPRSGSLYAYFMESFGPLHKFWGPLPGFIYSFVIIFVCRPTEVCVVVLTSADYIVELINSYICLDTDVQLLKKCIAFVELSLITYINANSVKLYANVQVFFTFIKVTLCLAIIAMGVYELCKGNFENIGTGFANSNLSVNGITMAVYSGLWAYDGWSCITLLTEEVKKPEVNILRSILLSIPSVTVFYVLMNAAYMTILSVDEIVSSNAVAMTLGERMLGSFAFIMPLGVAISTFGCATAIQIGVTRICYASAQEGHLPESFSYLHVKKSIPTLAVLLQGGIGLCVLFTGEVIDLLEFVGFILWLFYGFVMISVFILRKTKPDAPRPFRAPLPIAVLVVVLSLFLSITPLITSPSPKYFIAVASVAVAFIIYFFIIYKQYQPKCMEKFTYFVQVVLEISVPSTEPVQKAVVKVPVAVPETVKKKD